MNFVSSLKKRPTGRLACGVRNATWRAGCTVLCLCGLALVLLAGCRGAGEAPVPPSARLATAEPLWQQVAMRRQRFETLKGMAEARVYTPAQNVAVDNVVVVLRRFEAMRLEGIAALGQPLFLLVAEGGRFAFYAPQEARLLQGAASARNLERVFGITLAPSALQAMLIGDLPWATLPVGGAVTYRAKGNDYLWEGPDPQQAGVVRVWFDAKHLQPVRFEAEDLLGRLVLRVQYEDFQQVADVWMPYRIQVDQPLVDQRVLWHYSDVQLNVPVAPALFQVRVPGGTERVELE